MEPTDLDWLALCLVTESNRPNEWPYLAQVIENRRRTGRWGDTYRDVVTAKQQFSAFNGRIGSRGQLVAPDYDLVFGLMADQESPLLLMHAAAMVNGEEADAFTLVISAATRHYYSPISMKPAGSRPAWAASAKRLYTPTGVDPERFVFAEGVA